MSDVGIVLVVLVVLVTVIHGVGAYLMLGIRRELAATRSLLERTLKPWALRVHPNGVSSFQSFPTPVYAIWIFKGQCWELDLKSVPAGYSADSPPSFTGSFEGQRVKTECNPC